MDKDKKKKEKQSEKDEYENDLMQCNAYIQELQNGNVYIISKVDTFSRKTYVKLFAANLDVVEKNTNPFPSYRTEKDQVLINLEAIRRMLLEIISDYKEDQDTSNSL